MDEDVANATTEAELAVAVSTHVAPTGNAQLLQLGHRVWDESRCQKDDDSCSVSFLIFLPPSPLSVLLTSLRSAQANTHTLILCLSQILIWPRSNSHPTHVFLFQSDGNPFPKRVLIRKKPAFGTRSGRPRPGPYHGGNGIRDPPHDW
eukprot:COSAG01_NODE_26134_length_722_cov_8.479936_1_plen_147_part_10